MNRPTVKALLFDMGGVVLEIDFNRVFTHLASYSALSEATIRQRFSMDEAYSQHEIGMISGAEYFQHLRATLQLTASDADIEAGWNALFGQLITSALDAIDQARERYPCYGFTNTNAAHQKYWDTKFPRIRQSFDHLFVSSEIQLRKPDAEAFEHVLAHAGVEPEQMLFFDDSQENIDGAGKAGLQCVLVDHPDAVRNALAALSHEGRESAR